MSADARTVTFRKVLHGLAHMCGLDPDLLARTEAAALAEHLSNAAAEAWRYYDWPDAVLTEERALRPIFSLGGTYPLGTEVYAAEEGDYYVARQDSTGHPLSDGAYWERVTNLRPSLNLVNAGDNPIGEVLGVWSSDPGTDTGETSAQGYGYYLDGRTVVFDSSAGNTVWIRFRLPPPRFTTEEWDEATLYQPGDRVFIDPACYLALDSAQGEDQGPLNGPDRWRVQEVPELLEQAIKRKAKAEWLSAEGQEDKAARHDSKAERALEDASGTLSTQQGQARTYAVAVRSGRHFRPRRA